MSFTRFALSPLSPASLSTRGGANERAVTGALPHVLVSAAETCAVAFGLVCPQSPLSWDRRAVAPFLRCRVLQPLRFFGLLRAGGCVVCPFPAHPSCRAVCPFLLGAPPPENFLSSQCLRALRAQRGRGENGIEATLVLARKAKIEETAGTCSSSSLSQSSSSLLRVATSSA